MALHKIQVVIPSSTQDPADDASNTWFFEGPNDVSEAVGATYGTALQEFYKGLSFGTTHSADRNWTFKIYAWPGVKPNYPVYEGEFNPTGATLNDPLPPTVTMVLSFFNDTVTQLPRGRRRGRIYIPFLTHGYVTTTGEITVATSTQVFNGLGNMRTALAGQAFHCIWSQAAGAQCAVQRYRMDNSWDTIRRRKRVATQSWESLVP